MKLIDNIKVLTGQQPDPNLAAPPPQIKTILIVEDEKPLATILEVRLKEEGLTVIRAANGQDGLKMAEQNNPDIILLDLLMPIMDGKTMLRKLREIPSCKNIPVIVLTNAGEIDNIRETQFYSDAIEFLIKSNVTMEQIVEKVKRHTLANRLTI